MKVIPMVVALQALLEFASELARIDRHNIYQTCNSFQIPHTILTKIFTFYKCLQFNSMFCLRSGTQAAPNLLLFDWYGGQK